MDEGRFVFTADDQQAAEWVWREDQARKQAKRQRTELLNRKHLHSAIWKDMLHTDRAEVNEVDRYYEEHNKV
jgi:hypothetical protein